MTRLRGLLLVVLGAVLVFALVGRIRSPARASLRAAPEPEEETKPLPPPAKLVIRMTEASGSKTDLLDPKASTWERATPTRVVLNRTPRVYQTEKVATTAVPALEVRSLRTGEQLYVRLHWTDATKDVPQAPPTKTGEGDDPARLYHRPTGATSAFADAAAVMSPQVWSGKEYPSLVMGDHRYPVDIHYWNASRGAELLSATGRASQSPTGKAFAHRAEYADGHWTLTLALPLPADGCPVAFALWDGHAGDRDGLKCFSIWYILKKE